MIQDLRNLIENLEISKNNSNRDIIIEFYDSEHDVSGEIRARLSDGKVLKMTAYEEDPFLFMGGLIPCDVEEIPAETMQEICRRVADGEGIISAENYDIEFVKGSIFNIELQDSLGLDSIIAYVPDGFNPMELKWEDYRLNPNTRIDDLSLIYRYNDGNIPIPKEFNVPAIVAATLDEICRRGARKIGISQITFNGMMGDSFDGDVADKVLSKCVREWIAKGNNSSKIDEIYLILDPDCTAKKQSTVASYQGHVGHTFITLKHIDAVFAPTEKTSTVPMPSESRNPNVEVERYYYERGTEEELTVAEYKEKITEFLDAMDFAGLKRIATYGLYLKDESGNELSKKEDDEAVLGILREWVDNNKDRGVTIHYVNHYFPKK